MENFCGFDMKRSMPERSTYQNIVGCKTETQRIEKPAISVNGEQATNSHPFLCSGCQITLLFESESL